MKIILMRHGRPELDLNGFKSQKMSPIRVGDIVAEYKNTALAIDSMPPVKALEVSKNCVRAICSDLPRAVDSINRLEISGGISIDPEFRESSMPYLKWEKPHLSFFSWCVIFRLLWLLGFAKNGEPIHIVKKRAKGCAIKLFEGQNSDDTVLLLGHGILNRFIGSELKKRGWTKINNSKDQYWSYVTFEK